MNIVQENIDELNAVLKVKVVKDDYLPKVKSALKDYQKKVSIDGFRPGKVPTGLIQKKYGTSVKVDEINKLLSNSLNNYLQDNKVSILGNPMPNENNDRMIDWENQEDFEFLYDMGLAPKFDISISANDKMVFQTLKIDDKLIDKNIATIAKRYGKMKQNEVVEADDFLSGSFIQLNDAGEPVEGGISKKGTLLLEKIGNEETKKLFIGKKKGENVVLNAQLLSDNKTELATMLGVDQLVADILNCNIEFTINEITSLEASELNQEFFDKLFGTGNVNSEEEFRLKIKDELTQSYLNESDNKFYYDVVDYLLKKANLNLPDKFLLRYLTFSNREKLTQQEIENDFDKYMVGMKWQLIENRIAVDNQIHVTDQEMIDYVKNQILRQYGIHIMETMGDAEMDKTARRVLENEEEANKIHSELFGYKMKELFKSKFTLHNQEVDYDVFFNIKK